MIVFFLWSDTSGSGMKTIVKMKEDAMIQDLCCYL